MARRNQDNRSSSPPSEHWNQSSLKSSEELDTRAAELSLKIVTKLANYDLHPLPRTSYKQHREKSAGCQSNRKDHTWGWVPNASKPWLLLYEVRYNVAFFKFIFNIAIYLWKTLFKEELVILFTFKCGTLWDVEMNILTIPLKVLVSFQYILKMNRNIV